MSMHKIDPVKLRTVFLLIAAGILTVGAMMVYFVAKAPLPSERACTRDAKICPDGTAVGRTGPNCTFAPCPGE